MAEQVHRELLGAVRVAGAADAAAAERDRHGGPTDWPCRRRRPVEHDDPVTDHVQGRVGRCEQGLVDAMVAISSLALAV